MKADSKTNRGLLRAAASALAVLVATGCSGVVAGGQAALPQASDARAKLSPVPCSALTTLRALHHQLSYVKNRTTGDTLEYAVIGDGAMGSDVLVYFNGTGQIMTGWPMQLLTNSKYSPKIVNTAGYRKSQDGAVSLCHDYHLVLFDYPGVGFTPSVTYTHDDVAADVDTMLQDISRRYGISTATVDPVGWSLGTTFALKYAFLSPVSRPQRKIRDVVLYSGHGGGNEQAASSNVDGNSGEAACVQTLFEKSLDYTSGTVAKQIKVDLSELIFPYKGQGPKDSGTNSGCSATVTSTGVTLTVTPLCSLFNGCTQYIDGYLADIAVYPWKRTKGIGNGVYVQQREQSGDWDVAYCAQALPKFTSGSCTAYGSIQQSATNGGVCETNTTNSNEPVAVACDKLLISGRVTLMDGLEDLLVQWSYDKALAKGLNAAKAGSAAFVLYPGSTGHGILIQHPKWSQAQTYAALQH